MTRRAATLVKWLILASLLAAVLVPFNGAVLLFEFVVWVGIFTALRVGRRRFVARYGYGVKARAQARREWR